MKVFINYGDEKYAKTRDYGVKMALKKGGFDKAIGYTPADMDEEFKIANQRILSIPRGNGLWLWKPYFVYKALMEEVNEGDYLFYGDGGSFFIRSVDYIIHAMKEKKQDIYVTATPFMEKCFTKEETFEKLGCTDEKYRQSAQNQGSFLCFRKTQETTAFVKQWLDCCCNYAMIAGENVTGNFANDAHFVAHREDQSVLSLLSKKKGIKPFLDPSQFGKYPRKYWVPYTKLMKNDLEKSYPVCIILHRTADVNPRIVHNIERLLAMPHWMGTLYCELRILKIKATSVFSHVK